MNGKTILVTGGTGSFGKEFVKLALSRYDLRKLIIFSRDELKQHEMRQKFPDGLGSNIRYFIGDVRDRSRLVRAFKKVDIVIHAAALKQVPACEYNPFEAIKTNIMGTKNVIDAALDTKVEKVMAISTDKAVNPINLYGATKLCAEKIIIQANALAGEGGTRFSCCRYGNVLGSRGSVVPLFKAQREKGCITVTDPRMTRFWITLEQGVNFVMKCIEEMAGGETFIPRIPAMSITGLAEILAPDCEINTIGIRPGEKLHEVLLSADEARNALEFEDKFVIKPFFREWGTSKWNNGKTLYEDFVFGSNQNCKQLSKEEMIALLESIS